MAEKPILFSAPMVRAILEGRKSQTRRAINSARVFATPERPAYQLKGSHLQRALQNADRWRNLGHNSWAWQSDAFDYQFPATRTNWMANIGYAVGDMLWVRETCSIHKAMDGSMHTSYKATDWQSGGAPNGPWTSSIHMPRWASRITLQVTGVKIERLQDISEEDAKAEGVTEDIVCEIFGKAGAQAIIAAHLAENSFSYRLGYEFLWNDINGDEGPGSWDANPWVAAYTFERVK